MTARDEGNVHAHKHRPLGVNVQFPANPQEKKCILVFISFCRLSLKR